MTHRAEVLEPSALVDAVLEPFKPVLGVDYRGYRNHVCRLLNFYGVLDLGRHRLSAAVQVAAAHHDLGIWAEGTFDYIEPSMHLARRHLEDAGKACLCEQVDALIAHHHKLRSYRGAFDDSVERFRRADWIDVSLGALRFGLPRAFVRSVQDAFPDEGFHRRLAQLSWRQLRRKPWRPLPMLRW